MDRFKLKVDAAISLQAADCKPKKLTLIHSGALAAAVLLAMAIDRLIAWQMDSAAGGLGGLGDLAVLSTVRSVVWALVALIAPFWAAGMVYGAMRIVKGRSVRPADLLEGFRKFKGLLSSGLMMALNYVLRGILCYYVSAQVLMLTPLAVPLSQALLAVSDDPSLSASAALGEFYVPVMVGYAIAFAAVFLVMAGPYFYRNRLTAHLILDDGMGGMQAMFTSRMLMQRRHKELLLLDLSYWWYYLLELLAAGVAALPLILTVAGARLPVSWNVALWSCLIGGLAIFVTVRVLAKARISVTYAQFYEQVRKKGPAEVKQPAPRPQPKPQEMPKDVPWKY